MDTDDVVVMAVRVIDANNVATGSTIHDCARCRSSVWVAQPTVDVMKQHAKHTLLCVQCVSEVVDQAEGIQRIRVEVPGTDVPTTDTTQEEISRVVKAVAEGLSRQTNTLGGGSV